MDLYYYTVVFYYTNPLGERFSTSQQVIAANTTMARAEINLDDRYEDVVITGVHYDGKVS